LHHMYPMFFIWRYHCFFKQFKLFKNTNKDCCTNIIVLINMVDPLSIPWRWLLVFGTKFMSWCTYYHKFGTSTNFVMINGVSSSKYNIGPLFHLT
jgi:hypothetical protein